MRIRLLFVAMLLSGTLSFATEKTSILLTGASFAIPENGWFEIGCDMLGFNPINKSVSGQAIMQAAQAMSKGTLYTQAQLDNIEALVIMQVHNQNVANEQWLKEDYNDYVLTDATPYAVAYDYVIRKYKDDCINLKDVPTSKYFRSEEGKPAHIVLCTHWHDSRTIYNLSIRKLAEKWNLPLVEWDTQIGFTKDVPESDGSQPSLKFAGDAETINGTKYGWHPLKGRGQYIQKRMAEIYIEKMAEVFNISTPLSATLKAKDIMIFEEETPHVRFLFSGMSPWNLTYKINDTTYVEEEIRDNPLQLAIPYTTKETIRITPLSVNNTKTTEGTVAGAEEIYFADDSIVAFYDTHVHEAYKDNSFVDESVIQLKNGDGWTRMAYFSFNLSKVSSTDKKLVFRTYFTTINASDDLALQLEGNAEVYTQKLCWSTKDSKPFTIIGTNEMYHSELESYICWDVTDFVKQQKEAGAKVLTLRMSISNGGSALCGFHSTETDDLKYYPSILIAKSESPTGSLRNSVSILSNLPSIFNNLITIGDNEGGQITLSNINGQHYYCKTKASYSEHIIDTTSYPQGIYIIQYESLSGERVNKKLIKTDKQER